MERLVNNQFQFQVYHTTHTHTQTRAHFFHEISETERNMAVRENSKNSFRCCFIYQAFLYLIAAMLIYSLSTAWASCVSAHTADAFQTCPRKINKHRCLISNNISVFRFCVDVFSPPPTLSLFPPLSVFCFCYFDVLLSLALLLFNHVL